MTADQTFDVIAVGSGAGGLTTALRAHDLGLRVAVVESSDVVGGSTAFSGGQVWIGANHAMQRDGMADSLDDVRTYIRAIAEPPDVIDPDVFEQWVVESPRVAQALEEAGIVPWSVIPMLSDYHYPGAAGSKPQGRYLEPGPIPGSDLGEWRDRLLVGPQFPPGATHGELIDVWRDAERMTALMSDRTAGDVLTFGAALAAHLLKAALARTIPILLEHRVSALLRTDSGVTGVVCETPQGTVELAGEVVLATGAYDWNLDKVLEYSSLKAQNTGSVGPPCLQGDGIDLARDAGANIFRMPLESSVHVPGYQAYEPKPPYDYGCRMCLQLSLPHSFMVASDGRRFCDDSFYRNISRAILSDTENRIMPYYLIWDEQHHQQYGLDPARPGEPYPESMHVVSADTIGELARKLSLDPEVLSDTTERFNAGAREGKDAEFGRGENVWAKTYLGDPATEPNPLLGTVDQPPFYAIAMRLLGTGVGAAGVHAGVSGQALDPSGEVMPGLYAVGSTSAFTSSGTGYNSGIAIGRALVFGYLAAEHIHATLRSPVTA